MRYRYDADSNVTRLVVIRHGETYQNAMASIGMGIDLAEELAAPPEGASELDINPRGQRQAEALCDELARFHFDAVYASPLDRVRQTLRPWLAGHASREVVFRDELQEMKLDFSSVQPDVDKRHPDHFNQFLKKLGRAHDEFVAAGNDPRDFKLGNGESSRECQARTSAIYREILAKHRGQSRLDSRSRDGQRDRPPNAARTAARIDALRPTQLLHQYRLLAGARADCSDAGQLGGASVDAPD